MTMAYPLDVDAQNAVLDSLLGDDAPATMPATFEVALYAGDPNNGGVEMDSVGGYVRPTIANDTAHWPAAVGGAKTASIVDFGAPSAAWTAGSESVPATHFLLIDAADSTTRYFPGRLDQDLPVYGTELSVRVRPTVTWDVIS